MSFIIDVFAGFICGVLSGAGIGGGSLLLLYMTGISNIPQNIAQGINLLYFIPTSSGALISHLKNKLIDVKVFWLCACSGCIAAIAASFAATCIYTGLLKKLFGGFLIVTGLIQLIKKK